MTAPGTMAVAEAVCEVVPEVVGGPSYEPDARVHLQARKNLRRLEAAGPTWPELDIRGSDGGLLVQTADRLIAEPSTWRVVTDREPTESEWSDLEFAWRVAARVNSNTIVLVKDRRAVGVGAGQQNRRDFPIYTSPSPRDRTRPRKPSSA
mgnify:CR=1 FL=1